MNIYDFTVKDAKGADVDLEIYRGKVLLVVNTATGCAFTAQYAGLQKLYDTYREQGLEILDFPCNQFAHQAPGTQEEIMDFCQMNFGVTFPQFAKIEVNGMGAEPVFSYLKQQKGGVMGGVIKWNFTKFLIDRQGNVVGRFAPADKPEKLENKIKALL